MAFIIERQCIYCETGKKFVRVGKTITKATVNFFVAVSASVRMEQHGCHSTYFLKVL